MKRYKHIPSGDIYEYYERGNELQIVNGITTVPFKLTINSKDWREVCINCEDKEYCIEQCVPDSNNQYSLKNGSLIRLSDKERFSVDDIFKYGSDIKKRITSIDFFQGELAIRSIAVENENHSYFTTIHSIENLKKIPYKFTAEDDIKIYYGDKYWWVPELKTSGGNEPFILKSVEHCWEGVDEEWDKSCKVHNFGKKENAEEFIKWNEPRYSLNDLRLLKSKIGVSNEQINLIIKKLKGYGI